MQNEYADNSMNDIDGFSSSETEESNDNQTHHDDNSVDKNNDSFYNDMHNEKGMIVYVDERTNSKQTYSNLTASNSQSTKSLPPSGKGNQHKGKRPWTEEEDTILLDYVAMHGAGNWRNVQKLTKLNRNAQSCRLRWTSHLDPNVNKSPFTEEEDEKLMRLIKWENDIKWVTIASCHFPTRTGYQLQTRWHVLMNRQHKKLVEQGIMPEDPPTISLPRMSSFASHLSTGFSPTTPSPSLPGIHSLPVYKSTQLINSPKLCSSPSSISNQERNMKANFSPLSSPLSSPFSSSPSSFPPSLPSLPSQASFSFNQTMQSLVSPKKPSVLSYPPWMGSPKPGKKKMMGFDSAMVNELRKERRKVERKEEGRVDCRGNGGNEETMNNSSSEMFMDLNKDVRSLYDGVSSGMGKEGMKNKNENNTSSFPFSWMKGKPSTHTSQTLTDSKLNSLHGFADVATLQERESIGLEKKDLIRCKIEVMDEEDDGEISEGRRVFNFKLNEKKEALGRRMDDSLKRKRENWEVEESKSTLTESKSTLTNNCLETEAFNGYNLVKQGQNRSALIDTNDVLFKSNEEKNNDMNMKLLLFGNDRNDKEIMLNIFDYKKIDEGSSKLGLNHSLENNERREGKKREGKKMKHEEGEEKMLNNENGGLKRSDGIKVKKEELIVNVTDNENENHSDNHNHNSNGNGNDNHNGNSNDNHNGNGNDNGNGNHNDDNDDLSLELKLNLPGF